ncbi:hypothetical protein [Pelagibius sp.]|uniref:hypothetical protein n=1 Tax=Pelagibius sp. TaxID=1931238 RepID=UPI0026263354|nr:hypothetical protein [Pelagibius sp.]
MRQRGAGPEALSLRRAALAAFVLLSPLCLGGCVTGAMGAAGMVLSAVTGGGSSDSGSTDQPGAFGANSPDDLQQALSQTDDSVSPQCRRAKADMAPQTAADTPPESTPAKGPHGRCSLQRICLPGAAQPTEMMVCRQD